MSNLSAFLVVIFVKSAVTLQELIGSLYVDLKCLLTASSHTFYAMNSFFAYLEQIY